MLHFDFLVLFRSTQRHFFFGHVTDGVGPMQSAVVHNLGRLGLALLLADQFLLGNVTDRVRPVCSTFFVDCALHVSMLLAQFRFQYHVLRRQKVKPRMFVGIEHILGRGLENEIVVVIAISETPSTPSQMFVASPTSVEKLHMFRTVVLRARLMASTVGPAAFTLVEALENSLQVKTAAEVMVVIHRYGV